MGHTSSFNKEYKFLNSTLEFRQVTTIPASDISRSDSIWHFKKSTSRPSFCRLQCTGSLQEAGLEARGGDEWVGPRVRSQDLGLFTGGRSWGKSFNNTSSHSYEEIISYFTTITSFVGGIDYYTITALRQIYEQTTPPQPKAMTTP